MALAIDTKPLADHCMPQVQRDLDKLAGNTVRRFQVLRLCAHATVIDDAASTARRLAEVGGDLQVAKQEALDWQADQDEELNDHKVLECLGRQATASPLFNTGFSHKDFATTLSASCAWAMAPAVWEEGRSLSSYFHRYSLRLSVLACYDGHLPPRLYGAGSGDPRVIPQFLVKYDEWADSASFLQIVGASDQLCAVWHLQCDIVDLSSPKTSSHWRKRRRTAVNRFGQLNSPSGEEETSEGNRFKGVRYRRNRRKWIAEMKPPMHRNKVSFGDLNSAEQAARVVDVAFHYYNMPNLLNFPDSPEILSARPSPGAALNAEEKLRFVKNEAKWMMTSMVSSLPTSLSYDQENSIVDPLSPARRLGCSSVQITERWDAADAFSPVLSNCVNASQLYETTTTWMTSLVMSPAIPTEPVPPSPGSFQEDVVRGLLEQQ